MMHATLWLKKHWKMTLTEGRILKLETQDSLHWAKQGKLYSDLLQALRRKALIPLGFQQGHLNFCVRSTPLRGKKPKREREREREREGGRGGGRERVRGTWGSERVRTREKESVKCGSC